MAIQVFLFHQFDPQEFEIHTSQNNPTKAVTAPVRTAVPRASFGAPNVSATKRYIISPSGNVSIRGDIVNNARGAAHL